MKYKVTATVFRSFKSFFDSLCRKKYQNMRTSIVLESMGGPQGTIGRHYLRNWVFEVMDGAQSSLSRYSAEMESFRAGTELRVA